MSGTGGRSRCAERAPGLIPPPCSVRQPPHLCRHGDLSRSQWRIYRRGLGRHHMSYDFAFVRAEGGQQFPCREVTSTGYTRDGVQTVRTAPNLADTLVRAGHRQQNSGTDLTPTGYTCGGVGSVGTAPMAPTRAAGIPSLVGPGAGRGRVAPPRSAGCRWWCQRARRDRIRPIRAIPLRVVRCSLSLIRI